MFTTLSSLTIPSLHIKGQVTVQLRLQLSLGFERDWKHSTTFE